MSIKIVSLALLLSSSTVPHTEKSASEETVVLQIQDYGDYEASLQRCYWTRTCGRTINNRYRSQQLYRVPIYDPPPRTWRQERVIGNPKAYRDRAYQAYEGLYE
jgi:hypothetical protein